MPGVLSTMAQGGFGSTVPSAAAAMLSARPVGLTASPDVTSPAIHPTFFGQGGTGRKIAGVIGDALYALGGGNPIELHASMRRADMEQQQSLLDNQLKQAQLAALTRKAGQPQTEHVGDAFGIVDPDTGGFNPTYIAPTDAERYAMSMGAQRGTPDWMKALTDYTLRANGPTAFAQDQTMENLRQTGRVALEGTRQGNRAALKAIPTFGQLHPRTPGGIPGGAPGLATVPTTNLLAQLGG